MSQLIRRLRRQAGRSRIALVSAGIVPLALAMAGGSASAATVTPAWSTTCAHTLWHTAGNGDHFGPQTKANDSCNDININVSGGAYFQAYWYQHYGASEVWCTPSVTFNVLWQNFTKGDLFTIYDRSSNGEATTPVY